MRAIGSVYNIESIVYQLPINCKEGGMHSNAFSSILRIYNIRKIHSNYLHGFLS